MRGLAQRTAIIANLKAHYDGIVAEQVPAVIGNLLADIDALPTREKVRVDARQ